MVASTVPKLQGKAVRSGGAPPVQPKVIPGVKIWAFFGALIALFETYVLIKWVTGPNFEAVPPGVTPVPDGVKIAGSVITYGGFVAMFYLIYRFVWKPWRQSRTVTAEGLLLVWFATFSWFMDPFANMFTPFFTYNSWFPNMGSWVADIPFWQSVTAGAPGAMQAYPMLFIVTAYVWGLWGVVAAQAWAMRRMRARWPRMSTPALLWWSYCWGFAVFMILEVVYMRCGVYGYHAAIPSLTLWYGEYYQFPIYEAVFAGFWCLGYASLLYFRNDKGQTIVERGVERIKSGGASQIGLRFLAVTALATLIYMVSYNIPYWILNISTNEGWPESTQSESYWTNGICGPGTDRHCGDELLPLQMKGTGHFTLDGKFVLPDGTTLPPQVTEFKTGG